MGLLVSSRFRSASRLRALATANAIELPAELIELPAGLIELPAGFNELPVD
jgi:hypothetical protein